jgi:hypothetical protein
LYRIAAAAPAGSARPVARAEPGLACLSFDRPARLTGGPGLL